MLNCIILLVIMVVIIGPDAYQYWHLGQRKEVWVMLGLTLSAWLLGVVIIFKLAEPLIDAFFELIPERW